MEQIISKEELDKALKVEGKIRGLGMRGEMEFILKEEGREGLEKFEETMEQLGFPMRYKEIKTMNFYPLSSYVIASLVMKNLFNYDNKKFQEKGEFLTKVSLIVRLFLKSFVSLKKIIKEVSKMWRKYYTTGELKVVKLDEEKRYGIIRIENFYLHPFHRETLKGYFRGIVKMVVGSEATCEEREGFKGNDKSHEFLLKW
jgi:hypothetical protein